MPKTMTLATLRTTLRQFRCVFINPSSLVRGVRLQPDLSRRDRPKVLVKPIENFANHIVHLQRNVSAFKARELFAIGRGAKQAKERQLRCFVLVREIRTPVDQERWHANA